MESDAELGGGAQAKFTFVTGVIAREKVPAFERILWRACRGNVFLRQAAIEQPLEDPSTVCMCLVLLTTSSFLPSLRHYPPLLFLPTLPPSLPG